MNELLTLPQVAKMLGLAERTIYVWSQEGKLPAFKLGSAWRYRQAEIDEWLETQRANEITKTTATTKNVSTGDVRPSRPGTRGDRTAEANAKIEAKITDCEAWILEQVNNSSNLQHRVRKFFGNRSFNDDIVEQALKRIGKSKRFDIKDVTAHSGNKARTLIVKGK